MTRNLKALGLAGLAMLAFGTLYTSAAQAEGRFRAGNYPAAVIGIPPNLNTWSINGTLTVACAQESFSQVITSASSALEVAPSYASCSSNLNYSATIKPNGCTYSWTIGELSGASSATGTQAIECPAGKALEIARYFGGELRCLYALSSQSSNGTITYKNQGSGSTGTVLAEMSLHGMQAKVLTGAAAVCAGSTGNTVSVGYTGNVKLAAENVLGESVNFSVGAAAGLYLAGEASGEAAKQPRFESETGSEPLTVEGSQDGAYSHEVGLQIRAFACNSVTFTGQLIGPSNELPLDAKYEECIGNGNTSVLVNMKSCHYVVNVLNIGPPYAGSLDLSCSTAGDGIEVRVWATGVKPEEGKELCIIKIPAQEGLGNVGLETLGAGFDRKVAMDFAITGLKYQRILGTAVNCGAAESTKGTYTGGTTLLGL